MKKTHIVLVFVLIGFLCVLIYYLQNKTCSIHALKRILNKNSIKQIHIITIQMDIKFFKK